MSYSVATIPILRSIEIASSYATIHPNAQARTNISIWTIDVQSLYRKYTTDVKITNGQLGSKKNAILKKAQNKLLVTVPLAVKK